MANKLQRIILVHGAMHGAWCWQYVSPLLERAGFVVESFDLPGWGDDPTDPATVTFADFVARIVQAVRARPEPAMLVAHSMSGGPASRAAEEAVPQVAKLVYLTAMLPHDGEMLGTMANFDPQDSVLRGVRPGPSDAVTTYDQTLAPEIFYNTCSPELARWATSRLSKFAPTQPLFAPIRLSKERFGAIPKDYIVCTQDKAMPPAIQHWLCDRTPGVRKREIATDHSPFLSDPEGLARLLAESAQIE